MDNAEFFPPGAVPFFHYNYLDQYALGFIPQPYATPQEEESSRRPNMSTNPIPARKARKRLNGLNRERTVTTLTNHSHQQFSTASEPPAGNVFAPVPYANENMSSAAMMNTQDYDMPGTYEHGFGASGRMYHLNMNHTQSQPLQNSQQQQPQGFPKGPQRHQHGALHQSHHQSRSSYDSVSNPKDKPALPDGRDDLEILQNLKKLILDNQHPFYKAIPKPEYLAQLYKGQVPAGTPAKEFISNGKTSATELDLRLEPTSARNGRALASEAEVKALDGPGRGSTAEQDEGKNAVAPTPDVAQAPLTEAIEHENSANGAHRQTSEGSAVLALNSVHPTAQSPSGGKASDVPDVPPRFSPSGTDVKPTVHPPQVIGAAQDSMQVDAPPQSAALGVPSATVQQASSAVPLSFERSLDRAVPHVASTVSIPVVPSRSQGPQSFRDIQTTDSPKPAEVPETSSPSIPAGETVPFDGERPATRPNPVVSTAAPPAAVDIVPFGGTSSVIPGLGPVVSTSGFTYALASAQPNGQQKSVADIRSHPAPVVTPSSAAVPRPLNIPSGPPQAPVIVPASEHATRPSLRERLEQPPVHPQSRLVGQPSSESQSHTQDRNTINSNNMKGRNKKNMPTPYIGPPKGGDRSYNRPSGPSDGPPPSSAGAPLRAPFRGRSPALDSRKLPISPGSRGPPPRDYRGPPAGRSPSRERGGYSRPPPHEFAEARRDSLNIDGPPPVRYDARSSYPDYPPAPPVSGGRGLPPDIVPSGARGEYYGPYAPPQDRNNARWEDPYYKREWERGPPPASADRGRFDRDYEPAGNWDRPDRDFGDRDPPYPDDDRYTPREPERARPPAPYTPTYGRVRGRSPSPIGRPGPGDSTRPPVKRAREDFGPEYYTGPGGGSAGRPPVRRGPPADYAPPPRSGGGPGGADWPTAGGPPPPASAPPMGGVIPGGRSYLGRGDTSMEYSPLPDNYDRARSPPPAPGGRASYGGGVRGAYSRGPERYGGMRPPP